MRALNGLLAVFMIALAALPIAGGFVTFLINIALIVCAILALESIK